MTTLVAISTDWTPPPDDQWHPAGTVLTLPRNAEDVTLFVRTPRLTWRRRVPRDRALAALPELVLEAESLLTPRP